MVFYPKVQTEIKNEGTYLDCWRVSEDEGKRSRNRKKIWAQCRSRVSQPTLQREGDARAHGCVFQGRKMHGVATNVYLRKMSEKSESCGLQTLIVKDSGVIFTHGEGISTPHVHHKGWQPLIKCANMTSKCFIFPFLCIFVFLCFLYFLFWCGRQWCFPRSYVSSITMRKSDLRSSFKTKRWLSYFYLFSQDRF